MKTTTNLKIYNKSSLTFCIYSTNPNILREAFLQCPHLWSGHR